MMLVGALRRVGANESMRRVRLGWLETVTGSAHSTVAADELMAQRLAELGHH